FTTPAPNHAFSGTARAKQERPPLLPWNFRSHPGPIIPYGSPGKAASKERPGTPRRGWYRGVDMTSGVLLGLAHLRVARPSDDLAAVVRFYRDGLGLDVLSAFQDHDGFDGVMLGRQGAGYHLEFTRKEGHQVGQAPTEDNLLVFYLPDPAE